MYSMQDRWIYTVAGITDNMRSLANQICKRPNESSLSLEISNLLENLVSSVKGTKQKVETREGENEEIMDESKEDSDGAAIKKQVRLEIRSHRPIALGYHLGSIFWGHQDITLPS